MNHSIRLTLPALVRRNLMLRVLLPIASLLVALVAGTIAGIAVKDGETARAALADKARLIADIAARGTADAIWNVDPAMAQIPSIVAKRRQLAMASLSLLAADPDYVGSELTDESGAVLASDGVAASEAGSQIAERVPVSRAFQGEPVVVGTLELRLSTARADVAIARATWILVLVGGGALIVICGILLWILKSTTRPIKALTQTMAKLSSGDLATEIPALNRIDEVGQMAQAVAVFKHNALELRRMNAERQAADEKAEAERIALLERIAGEFEASVSTVLVNVTQSCDRMGAQAEEMAGRMTVAEDSTKAVMLASSTTSANIQTVAAAAEELSYSITEIADRVTDSATIATDTSNAAAQTSDTIAQLSDQAHRIGNIINLIHDIASQTNLLALNATIEAARAGEAGKGFAVVASEVKNLANQTARATEEISDNIQAIQAATARAVGEIKTIAEVSTRSCQIATGIAGAVEQQNVATREISSNVSRAASGTQVVAENIRTVDRNISDATGAAHHLLQLTQAVNDDLRTLKSQIQSFVGNVRQA